MLKPYQRRAFLAVLMAAPTSLAVTAAHAAAGGDSLWDVMARTTTAARNAALVAAEPARPARRSLGPVPGFTVPAGQAANETDSFFSKKKRRSGLFGSVGDWFDRLESMTGTKIKASGHETLSMRMDNVSGNAAAYSSDQYYGRGSNGVYNDTNVNIDATFMKYFHYQTTLNNSLYQTPGQNRVKLDYLTKSVHLEWGDINAGFQGNSLIDFNRYLSGMRLTNQWSPHFKTSILYSQTKAETRTITIPGNNSSGPYYVYAGQIVEGSDQVRVDNRDMVRGRDYTLDTFTGELNFLSNPGNGNPSGNVILSSQTIAVTFETMGYNQSQGSIYGIRTDFLPKSGLHFGLTYVTQQSRGSNGFQSVTQRYAGNANPGQPYVLDQPIDQTKPLIVQIDGVPLANGVDYIVVPNLTNQILIKQSVPNNVTVTIQYVPLNTTITPGNSSVLGLDGSLALGKLGTLTVETALSGLAISGVTQRGYAGQVRAELHPLRNLNTNIILRDISPTFSSIQTPGFNRNEKSLEISSDYTPFKSLHLNFDWEKAKRPDYSVGVGASQFTVNTIGNDTYDQYSLGAAYTFAKNATFNLTRTSLSTSYITGGQSSNVSDNATLNYTWRSLGFEVGASRYVSANNSLYDLTGLTGTTGSQLFTSNSNTFSKHIGLTWRPNRWLDLSGSLSDNAITSTGTGALGKTDARDSQLTARFSLIRNLRITYNYQLSDSGNTSDVLNTTTPTGTTTTGSTTTGSTTPVTTPTTTGQGSILNTPARAIALALEAQMARTRDVIAGGSTTTPGSLSTGALGTQIGGGANYNLGSFGNYSGYYGTGVNNGYGFSSFGGRSTTNRISLEYQPRPTMQIALQLDTSSSTGDYQYNNSRNNIGLNMSWQPSSRFQFNVNYSLQRILYNGAVGGTNSDTLFFALQGRPFGGKLGVQLGWQSMRTNSTVNFATLTTTPTSAVPTTTTTPATTPTTTTPTNTDTDLNSLSLRLDYPISRRYSLFCEMLSSTAGGYLASNSSNLSFGLDYALTKLFRVSVGWQFIDQSYKDTANAQYSYKVNSLLAQIGLNF